MLPPLGQAETAAHEPSCPQFTPNVCSTMLSLQPPSNTVNTYSLFTLRNARSPLRIILYRTSPNKRARRRGRNKPLSLSASNEINWVNPLNTLSSSAENSIKNGSGVSGIWPGKVKSRGAFIQAGAFNRQNTVFG